MVDFYATHTQSSLLVDTSCPLVSAILLTLVFSLCPPPSLPWYSMWARSAAHSLLLAGGWYWKWDALVNAHPVLLTLALGSSIALISRFIIWYARWLSESLLLFGGCGVLLVCVLGLCFY